jgi:pyrroloquinoline quinone (PQQ) biosynthesis protein C
MPQDLIADVFLAEISSFADRLQREHPLMQAALQGRVTPNTVVSYLAGVRCLLEHTPIHLESAANAAIQSDLPELFEFFKLKQREEEGHVRWAESDLIELERAFGVRAAGVTNSMLRMVAFLGTMVRTQPSHYLGYILFAEHATVQVGAVWVKALGERCGIPACALSSIAKHVELDQFHVAEGKEEINHLLRHVTDPGPFVDTLRRAMSHFEAFCDELNLSVERKSARPAWRGAAQPAPQ